MRSVIKHVHLVILLSMTNIVHAAQEKVAIDEYIKYTLVTIFVIGAYVLLWQIQKKLRKMAYRHANKK